MSKFFRSRALIMVTLVAFAVSISGCGYYLHPERRDAKLSQQLDTKIVVYDCLWLLVFIVPGVVALVVDGVNDTWYYTPDQWEAKKAASAEKKEVSAVPGTELKIRVHGAAPQDAELTLRLLDSDGTQIAPETHLSVTAGQPLTSLAVAVPADTPVGQARLVLSVNGQPQTSWNVSVVN